MKKNSAIVSIDRLVRDIDNCISDIVSARLTKDEQKEGHALFTMESLMVCSMQELSYLREFILDYVEDE